MTNNIHQIPVSVQPRFVSHLTNMPIVAIGGLSKVLFQNDSEIQGEAYSAILWLPTCNKKSPRLLWQELLASCLWIHVKHFPFAAISLVGASHIWGPTLKYWTVLPSRDQKVGRPGSCCRAMSTSSSFSIRLPVLFPCKSYEVSDLVCFIHFYTRYSAMYHNRLTPQHMLDK